MDRFNVLFVDDEQDNLDALRRLFRKEYNCFFAVGAVEAIRILQTEGPFAAIISDQRMPGLTGVELFEKSGDIRAWTEFSFLFLITNEPQPALVGAWAWGEYGLQRRAGEGPWQLGRSVG